MAPLEDRSQISVNTTAQEGATYEFNLDYIDDMAKTVTDLVPERDWSNFDGKRWWWICEGNSCKS